MRNKNIVLAVATAGVMLYGVPAFAADQPSDSFGKGTITFDGTITNAPCDITGGGDSAVHFGSLSSKNVGTTESHPQPFSIKLSNCTLADSNPGGGGGTMAAITKAVVTFALGGTGSIGSNPQTLHASGGTNVGIKIKNDTTDKFLNLNGTVSATDNEIPLITSSSTQSLNFTAYLISDAPTGGTVSAGDFAASATYTLAYN
ncbi:hypothetical protein GF249_11990 [Salmonella enterica subsp. enterica]|nr:hypothetical protein [Salmonella enterica subsp. enterica serovar Baildon]